MKEMPCVESLRIHPSSFSSPLEVVCLACLTLGFLGPPCLAKIDTRLFDKPGPSVVTIIDDFGMAAGGLVKFDVDVKSGGDILLNGEQRAAGYIVLAGIEASSGWYDPILEDNTLGATDPPLACLAPASGRFEVTESGSFNMTITQHDQYTAYYIVCQQGEPTSAQITATFLNLDPEGGLTQHLGIHLAMLPPLYAVVTAVCTCLSVLWSLEMRRQSDFILSIHYLCLTAIWFKTFELALMATYFQKQSEDGQGHDTLRATAVLFQNMSKVIFLLLLMLFSLGWGILRTSLLRREIYLVSFVFIVYTTLSAGHGFCESETSGLCSSVTHMEYVMRSLIILSIVIAINFNITNIRFSIQLPWTSSSALEYRKLGQYLAFRRAFIAYLLLPASVLIVKLAILTWMYDWVSTALGEFLSLLVYAHIGITFSPMDFWLLTRAFDHEVDQGGMRSER